MKNVGGEEGFEIEDVNEVSAFYAKYIEDLEKAIVNVPMGKPHDGEITSHFGTRENPFSGFGAEMHSGIDFRGKIGEAIKSTAKGRIIRADFGDTSVISVYIPSGSSGEERQAYKMVWLDYFENYIRELSWKFPNLIICGDYNIVHHPIDIHDPVSNKNSSGFLPEEREWLTKFTDSGYIDSFRHFNKDPHHYSWWSYRAGSRARNKGWRIDYCMIHESIKHKLKSAGIIPDAVHSDHCPVFIEIK